MADEVKLSSLRVSASMDASAYAAGAAQKSAADQKMIASGQQVAASVTATDTKISQAGDVLARLSRQYVDGYAAAQRFNSALNQLSTGIERGKITMQQAETILGGISQKYNLMGDAAQFAARGQTEFAAAITNANAKLAQQRNLAPVNQNQGGLARFGSLNATSQFQDIAITSAMGQSPLTIALQQGTQLGMALEQNLGDKGVKGLLPSLGAAFMGLLTPINLVAIGLTAVAAVAIQYGFKILDHSKEIEEALKTHKLLIDEIAKAYPHAADAAKAYQEEVAHLPQTVLAGNTLEDLRKNQEALRALQMSTSGLRIQVGMGTSQGLTGEAGAVTFAKLAADMDAGNLTARQLQAEIGKIRIDPALSDEAHKFADWLQEGANQAAQLEANIKGATAAASQLTGPAGRSDNGQGAAMQAFMTRNASALFEAQRQRALELQQIGARSPEERAAAARATVATQPFDPNKSKALRDYEIESAGVKALAEANQQLKDAQDERRRSLDRTLESARQDVDLIGKTTAEIEGLRMAAQLEADVREEAARNHVAADEAEIARIKIKAAEYGKLRALEQARDIITSQTDDIELQRGELGAIGQNTLARNASIASLKTEQQIRKLGIPLYSDEANAIRANTAELNALAEAQAKATLQADLAFERRQIGRDDEDQAIAGRLHSLGMKDDLNSTEAAMIRTNLRLAEAKDDFKGFFHDVMDGFRQGKDAVEAFTNALSNLAGKLADRFLDRAMDELFGMLTGTGGQSSTGGQGGGLLGGLFGLLGGGGKVAANSNDPWASLRSATGPNTVASSNSLLAGLGSPMGYAANTASTQQTVWNFFAGKGLQPHQIAGVMGNIGAESGFDPTAVNPSSGASGLFQHLGPRLTALGKGSSLNRQLEFAWSELQGPESETLKKLMASTDVRGATGAFAGFERAEGWSRDNPEGIALFDKRLGGAQASFAKFGGAATNVAGGGGADVLGGGAGTDDLIGKRIDSAFGPTQDTIKDRIDSAFKPTQDTIKDRIDNAFGGEKLKGIGTADEALAHLTGTSQMAAESLNKAGLAGFDTVKGLTDAAGGLSQFGSALSSFMAPGGGSGANWFQGLIGGVGQAFGGGAGGALSFMQGISPAATASIIGAGGGFTGLFHEGGIAGSPSQMRYVSNMGIFRGAQRLHSGGFAGDEVPAILRRGEPVFKSMEQARQMFAPANQNIDLDALASKMQAKLKIINVYDPSVVGDYVRTAPGEKAVFNSMRRSGSGKNRVV